MKKFKESIEIIFNTVKKLDCAGIKKDDLDIIMNNITNALNDALIANGLQRKTTTTSEVNGINKLIKKGNISDLPDYEEDEDIDVTIMKYIDNLVSNINKMLSDNIMAIATNDVYNLMRGKLFKYYVLNDTIPQISVYKRVQVDTISGYICTVSSRPYRLCELFPKDQVCRDAVDALSYKLSKEELEEVTKKATKSCQSATDESNISIGAKFYKNAIGQTSNKYYKTILNDLCVHVTRDLLNTTSIAPKTFNAVCLEWIASKTCYSTKTVSFKANLSFDADTVLYQYVKSAIFRQSTFGKIQ